MNENIKIAGGRNIGLQAAQFEWIAIHDADDIMLPHRLETQARAIRENPDVFGWGAWAQFMSAEGQLYHRLEMGPTTRKNFAARRAKSQLITFKDPTFVYRRDLALMVGGYKALFQRVPDFDLMDHLADCGVMLTIPEVVTHYRVHSNATTQGKQERNNLETRYLYYRRGEQDAGRPIPTFEIFMDWYRSQSWWTRIRWHLVDLSRERRYVLPIHLVQKAHVRVVLGLVTAVMANPGWFIDKVARVLKIRQA
jgi:glycosyltransferase involved in cell wall biosynthesis